MSSKTSGQSKQMAFQMNSADVVTSVARIQEYQRAGVGLGAVHTLFRDTKQRARIEALVGVITQHPVVLLHPHKVKQIIAWREEEGKPHKIQVVLK